MEEKVYLRVVTSKTGREDSESQEGGEIKQKCAISVGVNTTLRTQVLYHHLQSLSRHWEYDRGSAAGTDNGAIVRMDSLWTAHALCRSWVDSTTAALP